MALALYFLPILLQIAASRVHHHRELQEVQDKLAGVDLADVLIPILNEQEKEYKANNHSAKRVHALKKLIERSHVAIILAKPHDKGENNSIDFKYASSEEVGKNKHIKHLISNVLQTDKDLKHANSGEEEKHKYIKHPISEEIKNNYHLKQTIPESKEKHKHLKHPSSTEIENNNILKIASSEEISKEDNNLVSPENNKTKVNHFHKRGSNTKNKDSNEVNSHEGVARKANKRVSRKELKEENDNKKNIENHLKDILDSRDESLDFNKKANVEDNLHKSALNSEHKDSYEDYFHEEVKHKNENKHSLENKEKEEYTDSIKLLKDILNSRDGSSQSDEESVEDNNLQRIELNSKHKETNDNNSHEKVKHKDENQHSLVNGVPRKEDHKDKGEDKISIKHLKAVLNSRDESSESNKEDSNLHSRSGLNNKLKHSHEDNSHKEVEHKVDSKYSLLNHVSHKEKENHKNSVKHLQNILNSLDECLYCDEEDTVEDHDSLIKHIGLARLGNNLHFYNRHDNEKKHDGGVRNLFFHFA